jgi:hypothetical protein
MREIPPECELMREVEYNICMSCKDQCQEGKRIMQVFERHRTNKWHENMRQDISEVGQR